MPDLGRSEPEPTLPTAEGWEHTHVPSPPFLSPAVAPGPLGRVLPGCAPAGSWPLWAEVFLRTLEAQSVSEGWDWLWETEIIRGALSYRWFARSCVGLVALLRRAEPPLS